MSRVELGFKGERFLYLPISTMKHVAESALTGDLYLYSLGYFPRAQHHYINRPTGCNEYLFIYCTSGCGWVEVEKVRYEVTENQFVILPPNVMHSYGSDESEPWTIYWAHFRGHKAHLFAANYATPSETTLFGQSRAAERINIFEEIYATLNEDTSVESMHYANLCFAHFLGTFLFIDTFRRVRRKKEYSENVIKRVIHLMNDNIESRLRIEDLAVFSSYSPSYLYRKFVKEIGIPPMEYFTTIKIKKACELLTNSDMKINQIALKLGFREAQYFSRTFSAVVGLSPMEYRKRSTVSIRDSNS